MNVLATKDQLVSGVRGARADARAGVIRAHTLLSGITSMDDPAVAQAIIEDAISALKQAHRDLDEYFNTRDALRKA